MKPTIRRTYNAFGELSLTGPTGWGIIYQTPAADSFTVVGPVTRRPGCAYAGICTHPTEAEAIECLTNTLEEGNK